LDTTAKMADDCDLPGCRCCKEYEEVAGSLLKTLAAAQAKIVQLESDNRALEAMMQVEQIFTNRSHLARCHSSSRLPLHRALDPIAQTASFFGTRLVGGYNTWPRLL
jgi:hypothetical protein